MSNSGNNSPKSINSNTMYNSNSTSAEDRMDYDDVIYAAREEIKALRNKELETNTTEEQEKEIEAKIEELEDKIEQRRAELYEETRVKKAAAAAAQKGGKRGTRSNKKRRANRRNKKTRASKRK